jgi:hypothetical protein
MSFGVGGTITGGGSVPSAHHPSIQALLTKYENSKEVITNVTQRRPLFIFRLNIADLHPTTLMAWGLKGQKALVVSISLHPTEYLNVPPMIEVDVEGGSDDVERSRSNVVSHLQHVANHFARSISEEYQKSTSITGCATVILKAKSNERINKWCDASGNTHDKVLNTSADVVEVLSAYLRVRLPQITECCVVCDQLHIASNYQPTVSTVCTRTMCMFVFQRLNVGKDTTRDLALHPAVLEMLLTFTRAAVSSNRWAAILTPFPTIFDSNSSEAVGETTKDVEKLRTIFRQCKINEHFQSSPCKFSSELQSWIIASNASYVQFLSQRIPFITSGQHFILIQSSQKHAAAFEKNREGKKVVYAFHGSNAENWHSILRNGLVNASGTALMVNGAAYGSGIYMSPDLSTSLSYMRPLAADPTAQDCVTDPPANDISISPTNFLCVAICEVIEEEIKKSGSIWVQPREDHLMTRYILVFKQGEVPSISLSDEAHISALNTLTKSLQNASK